MNYVKPQDIHAILEAAIAIARGAGEIHLRHFRHAGLRIDNKLNDSDVVTTADREAEAFIISEINRRFPDHSVLSEESGASGNPDSGLRWIVDPLDGTTNFSQGLPLFCVSICVNDGTDDLVGVVYNPYLNELFHAVRGEGAWLNGKSIQCSDKTRLQTAVAATGFPVDKGTNPDNNLENVARIMPDVRGLRRLGSAAMDLAYVGAGFLDAYWEMDLHEWDVAAGRLIAKEAGARYTLWRDNNHRGICALAASPGIYHLLLQRLV